MKHLSQLALTSLISLSPTVTGWAGPQQQNILHQPKAGRVINAVAGDRACYLTIKDGEGRLTEAFATYEVCEQTPSITGRRVTLTYKMGEVNSASCGGEPICAAHDRVPLVTRARILPGSKSPAPAASAPSHLCNRNEVVVFSCRTGAKEMSVCASANASPTSGSVQYRFGKPGSPEIILPSGKVIPPRAATGAVESYAGGGAAWLRFTHGGSGYVVYTGIGHWGPHGETRDSTGVLIEPPHSAHRNMKCDGKVTSLLGPYWFESVGIRRSHPGEYFHIPMP